MKPSGAYVNNKSREGLKIMYLYEDYLHTSQIYFAENFIWGAMQCRALIKYSLIRKESLLTRKMSMVCPSAQVQLAGGSCRPFSFVQNLMIPKKKKKSRNQSRNINNKVSPVQSWVRSVILWNWKAWLQIAISQKSWY